MSNISTYIDWSTHWQNAISIMPEDQRADFFVKLVQDWDQDHLHPHIQNFITQSSYNTELNIKQLYESLSEKHLEQIKSPYVQTVTMLGYCTSLARYVEMKNKNPDQKPKRILGAKESRQMLSYLLRRQDYSSEYKAMAKYQAQIIRGLAFTFMPEALDNTEKPLWENMSPEEKSGLLSRISHSTDHIMQKCSAIHRNVKPKANPVDLQDSLFTSKAFKDAYGIYESDHDKISIKNNIPFKQAMSALIHEKTHQLSYTMYPEQKPFMSREHFEYSMLRHTCAIATALFRKSAKKTLAHDVYLFSKEEIFARSHQKFNAEEPFFSTQSLVQALYDAPEHLQLQDYSNDNIVYTGPSTLVYPVGYNMTDDNQRLSLWASFKNGYLHREDIYLDRQKNDLLTSDGKHFPAERSFDRDGNLSDYFSWYNDNIPTDTLVTHIFEPHKRPPLTDLAQEALSDILKVDAQTPIGELSPKKAFFSLIHSAKKATR